MLITARKSVKGWPRSFGAFYAFLREQVLSYRKQIARQLRT